jgi:hypothetical protein
MHRCVIQFVVRAAAAEQRALGREGMRNPFRRKDTSLPPCPPGFEDLWVTVHVHFRHPLNDADDPGQPPAEGYYQVLGLRIPTGSLRSSLPNVVTDGEIGWPDTEWRAVDPATLKADLRKQITSPQSDGIWFRSGRVVYAETGELGASEAQDETPSSARPN